MHGVLNPIARGGVAGAPLRPANFRLYRNMERLHKPQVKALSQNEKGKVVSRKAVATDRLRRRVLCQHLLGHHARVRGCHWPLPGGARRPGHQGLVPRDGHHLDLHAPRVHVHLPLRALLLRLHHEQLRGAPGLPRGVKAALPKTLREV